MKTNYELNDIEKTELKLLNKEIIQLVEEHIDLHSDKYYNLYCYNDETDEFNQNKFNAILMHLGLTY